ncbi:hypothetical protein MAM1_0320d09634 [Mucor ambiguus]|uniref:Kinesin motor domain-containing protein n=1 Tax=Mucor ambiguus TaxID=91626 RepID=A0A0C9N690_9FUNG|nr:hypothetical protein MAM1_0320d09634 [Mucor ambiguus]
MAKDSSAAATTTAVQVGKPLTERDRNQPRFANMANDDVLKIHDKTVQVVPQNKLFTFDHVFGTTSTQNEIFSTLGDSLIRKFIEGYNITILAYGQTSSGKTYTMGTAANGNGMNPVDEGIVPRSMALLFDLLHNNNNNDTSNRPISPTSSISSSTSTSNKSGSRLRPKSRIANRSSHIPHVNNSSSNNNNNPHKTKFTVKVSFIEIYNEDLHDLLNSAPIDELPPITIREDTKGRIYWTGVKEVLVHSTDDVLYYLEQGTQNRATGATDMNEKSSRSHAIFSVSLKQEKWIPSTTSANDSNKKPRPTSSMSMRSTTPMSNSRLFNAANSNQQPEDGEWLITTSKFHFVDLAGSERLKRTAAEGDRRKEGININAGLLALGNVISALGDPSKKNVHVPYRDSKLTRLLQDSLGGSATTLMIACASPVEYNLAETLNTLQYANRARNIKNRSEKNQVEEWMTTENIELLRTMIGKLKNELNYLKVHSGSKSSSTAHPHHLSVTGTNNEDMLDDLSSTSSSITSPSLEDTYHEQRLLISDLQRQLEELDGEASVTRERNRIVEKELQRIRLLESMTRSNNNTKEEQVDFQHLVEPVIEEYEKSVAKLESQLALTRAALNHSDMGYEEQQTKIGQLEGLLRTQEQTISELRLRLSKILEREQNNESYIHELESKLMKSANETTKDQEMLNELKNRIMKFKETDENTEQYILNLEQRLAAGDAERARLQTLVEDLEAKIEAKERTNVELLKRLSKTTSDTSTEKLILKELDAVNAKYKELEGERDSLQLQISQLQKEHRRISNHSLAESRNNDRLNTNDSLQDELSSRRLSNSSTCNNNGKAFKNRKSFADETETASSVAALNLLQAEIRLKEETERANHLQLTIDRLQYDHAETAKELDEVLQRYHETLEQLDFLERESSSATAHNAKELPGGAPASLDLSKEIAQAKEDEHEQEKQHYASQIHDLEHRIQSLNNKLAITDSELDVAKDRVHKLEQELVVANKQIDILRQMESDHNAAEEVEHILDNLHSQQPSKQDHVEDDQTDVLKAMLASEKKQSSHWKLAHSELQQDMEKLALDLDGKEQYISQLKEDQVDRSELRSQLDESNQQATSLQKRLAETLASLTVLKISHDGLQKKLHQLSEKDQPTQDQQKTPVAADDTVATLEKELSKHAQEKSDLLDKHQSELAVVHHNMETKINEINALLKETTIDKDNALQRLLVLEQELKTQAESIQNSNYLEQEKMLESHNAHILQLTQQFDISSNELRAQITSLQQDLDSSKAENRHLAEKHDAEIAELTENFEKASQQLLDRISEVEQELEESNAVQERLLVEHDEEVMELSKNFESATRELEEQISELESELEASKDLHEEILSSHSQRLREVKLEHADTAQKQIEQLQAELEALKASQQGILETHANNVSDMKTQHQQMISTLKKQVGTLQSELEELNKTHANQLKDVHAQHEQHLDDKVTHGKSLLQLAQTELDSQKAENLRLAAILKEQEQTSSATLETMEALQKEHQGQLKAINEQHKHTLDQEIQYGRDLIQQIQAELDTYKGENEKLSAILKEQAHSLQALEELKKSHSDKLSLVQSEHKELLDQQIQLVNHLQTELDRYKSENSQLSITLKEQQQASKDELFALQSRLVDIPPPASPTSPLPEQEQPDMVPIPKTNNSDRVSKKIALLESQLATAQTTHTTPLKNQVSILQAQLDSEVDKSKNLVSKLATLESSLNAKHQELLAELEAQYQKEMSDTVKAALERQKQELASTTKTHDAKDELSSHLASLNATNNYADNSKHILQKQPEEGEGEGEQLMYTNNDQSTSTTTIKELTQELEILRTNYSKKEDQMQQLREENSEYTLLSSELEKEINRMTHEIEDLQFSDELVHQLLQLYDLNDQHQLMDTVMEERKRSAMSIEQANQAKADAEAKAKQVEQEMARAATAAATEASRATQAKSSDKNNDNIDGSGAISQQQGPSTTSSTKELQQELEKCRQQIKDMPSRQDMLDLQDKLTEEKKKYEQSERARKKLEKQLEELLSKKSSFMCF